MTVASSTDRATFPGNGIAQIFPLPFRFFANSEIQAWLVTNATGALTALTLGTHYTLSGAGDPEVDGNPTSELTMLTAPTSLQSLFVQRVIPLTQPTDIVNQGRFLPEIHENVFDRLTMLMQQAIGESEGAIRVAIGDPEPARLAPAVSRANQLMGFDSAGNPIAVAPTSGDASDLAMNLASSADPAKGSGMVGYKGRTVYARLSDTAHEKDYGVVRDGVADDTANLQAAINDAAANGKVLISGSGVSIVTGLTIPSGLQWECNASVLKLANNTDANILVNSDTVGGNSDICIYAAGSLGLELDGNKANQGAISRPVALFKNCDNVTLRRVKAHDAKITTYTTDTFDQILFVDCNDCEVEKCESYNSDQGGLGFYGTGGFHRLLFNDIHDCEAGIEGAYQTDSHLFGNKVRNTVVSLISWSGLRNIIYKNNVAVSTAAAGIVCGHSGSPTQVADESYVTENFIEDVFSYGVTVFSSAGVTVEGNKIKRASGNSTHSIFVNTGCADVSVIDNRIVDYFTSAAGASGIFVDGCPDATLRGNKVYGATGGGTGAGIRLFGACPDAEISGGLVADSAGIGLNISATSPDCAVNGLRVRNGGGVGIQAAGIGVAIAGVVVRDVAGAQGILVSGGQGSVVGARVSGVQSGSGTGIFFNAVDYNAVVGNILETCATGISLPSGTDNTVAAANTFTADVAVKVNIGTNTGTKVAHNIGQATHDI